MLRDLFKTVIGDYERLLVSKVLLALCFVGGFMMTFLLLAILLMLLYPPYVWCVWGGFVFIWIVCVLGLCVYVRLVRAEHQARLAQWDSLEQTTRLLASTVTSVLDYFTKKKH